MQEFNRIRITPKDDDATVAAKANHRLLVWNAWAGEVDIDLQHLRRPAFMNRPATLPNDDIALWSRLKNVKDKGGRAPQADRELFADWQHWMKNVQRCESIAARNLETVLCALHWSEKVGDASLQLRCSRFRSFAMQEYGVEVAHPCPDDYRDKVPRWATDRKLLPSWMITFTKPTMFMTKEQHADEFEAQTKADRRVQGHVDDEGMRRVVSELDLPGNDGRGSSDS